MKLFSHLAVVLVEASPVVEVAVLAVDGLGLVPSWGVREDSGSCDGDCVGVDDEWGARVVLTPVAPSLAAWLSVAGGAAEVIAAGVESPFPVRAAMSCWLF